MPVDEFATGLARIRQRFGDTLRSKIDENIAALPKLSDKDAAAIETIVVVHRKLHEMCGIAPSIGFPATGNAARGAEGILREPALAKRPLTTEELTALVAEFDSLRDAAQADMQSSNGEESRG